MPDRQKVTHNALKTRKMSRKWTVTVAVMVTVTVTVTVTVAVNVTVTVTQCRGHGKIILATSNEDK